MNAHELWLAEAETTIPSKYRQLLRRAVYTLNENILTTCPPRDAHPTWMHSSFPAGFNHATNSPPWLPLRGICPSPKSYPGVWNWDSAFHAMAVSRWDAGLAREQIDLFLDRQLPNGALVDAVFANGHVEDAIGKPPVMPWAAAIVHCRNRDALWIERVYPKFTALEGHWRRDRGGDADGLFHYAHNNESGWDTSVRWDQGVANLWPVDLNCYMVLVYRALAFMACELGRDRDLLLWNGRMARLADAINARLYDASAGVYLDYNHVTGAFSTVLTPASFMPFYAGIAPPEHVHGAAHAARDARRLYPAFPSVAFDHPAYRSFDYWRGPTWLNVAFFALWGLQRYGLADIAEPARESLLQWCASNEHLHEYYDSRTGQGLGARDFGWSAVFVIELLVAWDRNNGEDHDPTTATMSRHHERSTQPERQIA